MLHHAMKPLSCLCLCILLMGLPNASFASEALRQVYTSSKNPFNVATGGHHYAEADIDGSSGGYSVTEYSASFEWKWLGFSYTGREYDWDNVSALPFGNGADEPWETLHTLTLGANFDGSFNKTWGWFAGATIKSSFEEEIDDSFSGIAQAGFIYQLADDWRVHLGIVGVVSQDDPKVLPFVGINYRSLKDLGWALSFGFPATYASYRFNEIIALRAGAAISANQYRLADNSTVAQKGYLEEEELTFGLYADITPKLFGIEHLLLSIGAEYVTMRELTIYDSSYDKIREKDVDDTFGGFVRLQYTF